MAWNEKKKNNNNNKNNVHACINEVKTEAKHFAKSNMVSLNSNPFFFLSIIFLTLVELNQAMSPGNPPKRLLHLAPTPTLRFRLSLEPNKVGWLCARLAGGGGGGGGSLSSALP